MMKGVVLAGGLGTRLNPLTRVTNKHLLPIYDRPMIYYPIRTLLNAGIDEILIVTGGEHAGDFLKLLGNGKSLGIRELHYTYQQGEGGIADALLLAEDFAERDKVCIVLGDNIIERNICAAVGEFFTFAQSCNANANGAASACHGNSFWKEGRRIVPRPRAISATQCNLQWCRRRIVRDYVKYPPFYVRGFVLQISSLSCATLPTCAAGRVRGDFLCELQNVLAESIGCLLINSDVRCGRSCAAGNVKIMSL